MPTSSIPQTHDQRVVGDAALHLGDEVKEESPGQRSLPPRLMISPAKSELPMKKKPAIGITTPIALNAKTRPSTTWVAAVSRELRPSRAIVAARSSNAAMPPTRPAASPPVDSGTTVSELAERHVAHQRGERDGHKHGEEPRAPHRDVVIAPAPSSLWDSEGAPGRPLTGTSPLAGRPAGASLGVGGGDLDLGLGQLVGERAVLPDALPVLEQPGVRRDDLLANLEIGEGNRHRTGDQREHQGAVGDGGGVNAGRDSGAAGRHLDDVVAGQGHALAGDRDRHRACHRRQICADRCRQQDRSDKWDRGGGPEEDADEVGSAEEDREGHSSFAHQLLERHNHPYIRAHRLQAAEEGRDQGNDQEDAEQLRRCHQPALKTEVSPVARLPVKAQAVKKVAATAGTTTFFRAIITAMITTMPSK